MAFPLAARRSSWTVLVAALCVGPLVVPSSVLATTTPPVTFTLSPNVNAWWVEVYVSSTAGTIVAVSASVNGGPWISMAKDTWGSWARSFYVPMGTPLVFEAQTSTGAWFTSGTYAWLESAAPAPAPPPAPAPANVTFSLGPNENNWWVEVYAASTAGTIASVTAQVNGASPIALTHETWGSWARSTYAPTGASVVFHATLGNGAQATSSTYAWLSPTAPTGGTGGTAVRVTVTSNGFFLNGTPFLVKGVAYNPIPIGQTDGYDWYAHPEIYTPDLAAIHAMGANTVRLYHTTTNIEEGRAFLDAAHRAGLMVLIEDPTTGSADASNLTLQAITTQRVMTLVNGYKDHPALLGYLLGNEVDRNYKGTNILDWYHYLDSLAVKIHGTDPNHPVGSAFTAGEQFLTFPSASPHVDFYGANLYMLNPGQITGYFQLAHTRMPNRPVLVTEFGCDVWNVNNQTEYGTIQAAMLERMWLEIAADHTGGSRQSAGGAVFEWVDEWWKSGSPSVHTGANTWTSPSIQSNVPDGSFSEAWMGIVRQDRTQRPAVAGLYALWGP
ncbi:MAG: glycoside hydrolase family 2 TIM barrel-domain containing protein [Thermoplasmatota archaeon]